MARFGKSSGGGIDLRITGADDLDRVAKRLKAVGAKDLRKELFKTIRDEAKPAIAEVKARARRDLPKRGGLAASVSRSSFGVRSRAATGSGVGVRIQGTSRSVKSLRDLDRGRLRHPVFGRRSSWVEQSVKPGFFSETIEERAPQMRVGMMRAMKDIAAKVERSV